MVKHRTLLLIAFTLVLAVTMYLFLRERPPHLPAKTRVLSPQLIESNFKLRNLTLGGKGSVYGSRGRTLFQIVANGSDTRVVHEFGAAVKAIHEREDGLLIVATDDDHWDPLKPCLVYRSLDHGLSFVQIKSIEGGCALWWSVDSDSEGRVYLAEYGPHDKGMSKTLWRSDDDGVNWKIIFRASDEGKIHLHRVAVDPYTDDIWLTVGDGTYRAMLSSKDRGENWQQVERLQSTAVAFSDDAIYWGRDKKGKPGVLRYGRDTQSFDKWFDPGRFGNYGGSVYDMVRLPSGDMLVSFMKYPDQTHVASVWRGQADHWELVIQPASELGKGSGFETIAGPDKNGWVYMPGYQIRVQE